MMTSLTLHVVPDLPPGQPLVTTHRGEGAGHQGAGTDQGLVPGFIIVKRLGLGPGTWDLGPGTWDLGPRT